ncbi:hypothetical protein BH09VER1_BH09VER1_49540 [soil metagenome]
MPRNLKTSKRNALPISSIPSAPGQSIPGAGIDIFFNVRIIEIRAF